MQDSIIIMVFVKKYDKIEVLKLIASIAIESLPNEKTGIIDARYTEDDGIEIYFIERDANNKQLC